MKGPMSETDQGEQPLVSVVIPTHNRAHCLERSISSVLNQTHREIEVIVVDDCSTDNTDFLIKSFSDERLQYIKLQKKSGACAARNVGILHSSGDYIAFQDSDDEWLPNKLELQIELLRFAPVSVGLVYGRFYKIANGRQLCRPNMRNLPEGNVLAHLLKDNFVGTPVMVVRRECFDKVGLFDEQLRRFQDWEFVIRVADSYEFRAINISLATAYEDTNSITKMESEFEALEYIHDKHKNLFSSDPVNSRILFRRMAFSLTMQGDPDKGRKYLEMSFQGGLPLVNRAAAYVLNMIPNVALRPCFSLAASFKNVVRRFI